MMPKVSRPISTSIAAIAAVMQMSGGAWAKDACFVFGNNQLAATGTSVLPGEASTAQVLEVLAERRTEASAPCPPGTSRVDGICTAPQVFAAAIVAPPPPAAPAVAATPASAPISTPSPAAKKAAAPAVATAGPATPVTPPAATGAPTPKAPSVQISAPAPAAKKSAAATSDAPKSKPAQPVSYPSRADDVVYADPASSRRHGAWTEAFVQREFRPAQRQDTAGVVVGYDHRFTVGGTVMRVGGIGSYTNISASANGTGASVPRLFNFVDTAGTPSDLLFTGLAGPTTQSSSRTNGAGAGATFSASRGGWFVDGLAKFDFFDVSRRSVVTDPVGTVGRVNLRDTQIVGESVFDQAGNKLDPSVSGLGCIAINSAVDEAARPAAVVDFVNGTPTTPGLFSPSAPTTVTETASLALFTLASNLGRTIDLANGVSLDPSVGFRYTHASFYNVSSNAVFQDSDALRLEAGAKLSHARPVGGNAVWTNALGFYLYSDVWVTGAVTSTDGTTLQSDEGQIRARGMLQSRMQFNNGVQLFGEVNGRVGRDYQAVGGKVGARIEW